MSPENLPTHSTADRDENKRLAQQFKAAALTNISDLLDKMFDSADTTLLDMSDQAENHNEQGLFQDSMQLLREHRPQITENFIHEFSAVIDRGIAPDATSQNLPASEDDLDLLPTADLEQNVAVASMSARAAGNLRREFSQLQARLETLAERAPGSISPNGLSPAAITLTFQSALAPAQAEMETTLVIYKLFEQSVLNGLRTSYRQLDQLLERAGVHSKPARVTASAAQLRATARQQRSELRARRFASLDSQIAPENQFATSEVLASLAELINREPQANLAPGKLLEALQKNLHGQQQDSVPRSLQRAERRLIGMAAAMFKNLLDEAGLSPPARDLVSRMRGPVMQAAILDPDFFRDADHPARRVVNEIAALDASLAAHPDALAQTRALVNRLITQFRDDPGILERIAQRLQELSAALEDSDADEGPAERQARVDRAKKRALLEVRQQSLGRHLPPQMKPFLLKAWGPFMAYQSFRHGGESSQWYAAGTVLTRLLDAVQPPGNHSDHEALANEQARLLATVRNQLTELSMGRARVSEQLAHLEQAFQHSRNTVPKRGFNPDAELLAQLESWIPDETVFDDEGGHDATGAAFDMALTEVAQRRQAQPGRVPVDRLSPQLWQFVTKACAPGTWFHVMTGAGRRRWLKVAEIESQQRIIRFATRQNEVVYERDALPFLGDLQAKRSRPIYKREKFEKRLDQLLTQAAETGR